MESKLVSFLLLTGIVLTNIITSHNHSTNNQHSTEKRTAKSHVGSSPLISVFNRTRPEELLSDEPSPKFGYNFLTGENNIIPEQSISILPRTDVINLGATPTILSPCATIITTSNFARILVPDDATHYDIAKSQLTFAFGLINDQCSLTIRDCTGSYFTASNYFPGGMCSTAASVCCECNGCSRPNLPVHHNSTCAVLFQNFRCSMCHGFRLEVAKGDETAQMHDLVGNKVSSIYVVPGCQLTIYPESDFQGCGALAEGSLDYLPHEWNDAISSYKCSCHADSAYSTTTLQPVTTPGSLIPIGTTENPVSTTPFREKTTTMPMPTPAQTTNAPEETTPMPTPAQTTNAPEETTTTPTPVQTTKAPEEPTTTPTPAQSTKAPEEPITLPAEATSTTTSKTQQPSTTTPMITTASQTEPPTSTMPFISTTTEEVGIPIY